MTCSGGLPEPTGGESLKERVMGRVAVAVIVSLWVIPITLMVNHIVPEPYMDEIFHIPQAQQYCRGNFRSWDPMITTPPGLYYLSLAHVALFPSMLWLRSSSSFSDLCSTAILRSSNGALTIICAMLLFEMLVHLRPDLDERKATLYTVVLALYPLHWFFSFLYYTDVASLTVVLSMYLACLKKHYHFSSLLGALAILIRQTNAVWVLFVACDGAITFLGSHQNVNVQLDASDVSIRKNAQLSEERSVPMGTNLRKRKMLGVVNIVNHSSSAASSSTHVPGLLNELRVIILGMWHLKWELMVYFGPFLVVLLAFAMFILWNGSVVLGAKEAHAVSPHFAQIMYFGLFSALAMAPLHFNLQQAAFLHQSLWKRKPLSFFPGIILLAAGIVSVHFFSIAHPYLLADNRHYTFYLWRKVIKAHWSVKYLLVPVYVYSWLSIFSTLGKIQKKIWVLVFFLATAAVLVPAPLIEFRYYTVPFYFLILNSRISDTKSYLIMGMLYIAVNIFTMMMFLFRPFHWKHEPGTQRFIW
ncbi:PREDICTED: dol-P-Glc:Glc(2)Man(9)GlcNAc(2)-PP-Dol alpha-1,2-glucosyltransferase isoform X2 [Nelumbo nucifera]|uniref:Dol-P-Glc:Glc(2)Man(9)GlcNAc(2)-PP-Dol alpha-1,2-glucosyltransferase n=1 Tax=Nelumbo nucifera TaxID=4432 RepID=A0A1U7ZNX4_NELNU|nr:PREDICTED: dol-P-Glc:Glc(2)Man(9)GlcNAc(2)-PP-Dol alpha-1,2-glucosyltransferase isoform X2 [Nelumbo nucifera]